MSLTDPVADMLTRIRNACTAGHRRVDMPVSKLKLEIARLLRDNHYIADFKNLDDGGHGMLRLYLKYHNDQPVIRELRRVSTPGLRRYVKCRELPRVRNGLGMAIVSTPKGLMSDRDAELQPALVEHPQTGRADGVAEALESAVRVDRQIAVAIERAGQDLLHRGAASGESEVLHQDELRRREAVVHLGHRELAARVGDAGLGVGVLRDTSTSGKCV